MSLVFMKERSIVSNVRKHPFTMVNATMDYAGTTSSNIKFLLEENVHMENNMQAIMKWVEQSTGSAMAKMRKVILAEVSTLEATMRKLYDGFVTMHKVVFHLYDFQKWCRKVVQTLKDIHVVIAHV